VTNALDHTPVGPGGCGSDPARCSPASQTPTERNSEQTQIGIYWGYDGTPGLGTPPRLYNQIVVHIADEMGSNAVELARLLALVNTALADAGTDRIAFSFVSDEFNGVTRDNKGNVRPRVRRRFSSLSQAEEENGQSRIYLGIHWAFDKIEGIAHGRTVGSYVFENAFQPLRRNQ
jgi:Flp pilus assembly pilin Flp